MYDSELRYRDEFGAGYASLGFDGNPHGCQHIVDARTKDRVYQLRQCTSCGRVPWASMPSGDETCVNCKMMDAAIQSPVVVANDV